MLVTLKTKDLDFHNAFLWEGDIKAFEKWADAVYRDRYLPYRTTFGNLRADAYIRNGKLRLPPPSPETVPNGYYIIIGYLGSGDVDIIAISPEQFNQELEPITPENIPHWATAFFIHQFKKYLPKGVTKLIPPKG